MQQRYRGRFAPSPTGPLHLGSLVTALASWLDARAHGGDWLVRIEDIDYPRCVKGADADILRTLETLGLHPDEAPVWQSRREARYADALRRLDAAGQLYPCGCSRKEIADSLVHVRERHQTLGYPGTCRNGLHGKLPRAWRVRVPDGAAATVCFDDRWQARQCQNLETELGDFVLRRADGLWAYQLAVVVNAIGEKLSKQSGAQALDTTAPVDALRQAGAHLGIVNGEATIAAWLAAATGQWAEVVARRQTEIKAETQAEI